jgi:hypothetical protein
LPSDQRTALESALAAGTSISSIARQPWTPGRDSIRGHIAAGHLPQQLQDAVERQYGLDSSSIAARVVDAAQRARETALDALENNNHTIVLRAGDAEVRALSMLSAMGETSEQEIQLRTMFRDVATAVIRVARRDPATAEIIAVELDRMHRPAIADDIRDQFPDSENEVSA